MADNAMLDALLAAPGGSGIEALTEWAQDHQFEVAPFVVIEWGSSIRVVVFGDVEVRSNHPSMPRLSSAGSGTWVERTFPAETQLELSVNGDEVNPVTDLRGGAVEAAGFTLTLTSSAEQPESFEHAEHERNQPEAAPPAPAPAPDRAPMPPTPEPAIAVNAAELVARVLGGASLAETPPAVPSLDEGGDVFPPAQSGWALRFDDGETELVDAVLILGRSPRLRPSDAEETTRLIAVDSAKASTNHLEVRALDDQVVITDLDSRNGSFMVTSGDRQLVQLSPGEPYRVGAGTAVQIGTELFSIERADE